MNIWQNAVLTNKGLALQSKLIAGTTLTITRAVTGAGYVTPGLLPQQTAVTSQKQTLSFRPVTYPASGKCCLSTYLTNDGLATGYTAMQVGIYAQDPDEGEILYFIAQAESGTGTVIPSATEMPGYNAEWNMYFQYGQADSVSVTVDPANTVSQAQLAASAYLLAGGTEIPANADLNTYQTPGNYYCRNNTNAATLANCPTKSAFTMKVEMGVGISLASGSFECQTLREYNTGALWFRYYGTLNDWTAWQPLAAPYAWTTSSSTIAYLQAYIDPSGDDNNPGTQASPMATIAGVIRKYAMEYKKIDIYCNDGTYTVPAMSLAFDGCDLGIRSTSQDKDAVTLNFTGEFTNWLNSLRLNYVTINQTGPTNRAISINSGELYANSCRINVPENATAHAVCVYNGSCAYLYECVINSSSSTSYAAVYGNQAMLIKAVNCTSERTVGLGFYANNASNIEYTATLTATMMTKEANLGKCYLTIAEPIALNTVSVAGEDLNNYTDFGIYAFAQAYAPTNAPTGNVNGWLIVIPWNVQNSVATIKQIWLRHGVLDSNDHQIYVRTKISSSNAWSSWAQIYTSKDITLGDNGITYETSGGVSVFIAKQTVLNATTES